MNTESVVRIQAQKYPAMTLNAFEHAALELDFKGWPFWGDTLYIL